MINEKKKFLTVSWLSGLLSAEIFISTGEWGVQMPPLTSENSHFPRSGPQEATLAMSYINSVRSNMTYAAAIFVGQIWFILNIIIAIKLEQQATIEMNGDSL